MNLHTYSALLFVMLGCILSYTNSEYRMLSDSDQNIVGSPYLAQIFIAGTRRCVGSLISEQKVITTASCLVGFHIKLFVVAAGVPSLRYIMGQGQMLNVRGLAWPNGYNEYTKDLNIGVITVIGEFKRGPRVDTIKLCSCTFSERPTQMHISRLGRPIAENENSILSLMEHNDCKSRYENRGKTLTQAMICATHATADIYMIDAGTPGIINGELCAVASHHLDCADHSLPTVFTNITDCGIQEFFTSTNALIDSEELVMLQMDLLEP